MTGRIVVTSGDAAGRVLGIDGELLLGRKGDGAGKLPGDIEISRAHARLFLDPESGLTIEDLGSTNGTFVRGMRITNPWVLSPGDSIRVGRTTLEVLPSTAAPEEKLAEAPPEPEPAPPEPAAAPAPRPAGAGVRPLVYVLVAVLAMAALGIAAVVIFTGDDEEGKAADPNAKGPAPLVAAATEAGCVSQDLPPEGNRTVAATTDVRYRSNPPNSGDHAEKPASDGIWETAPPLPKIVGSLEKGRVVMWHRPADEKGIRLLREVGDQSPKHMLLVPNASMRYRVAATAWGHVLGCRTINGSTPEAVAAFRDAYRDKGPEFEP